MKYWIINNPAYLQQSTGQLWGRMGLEVGRAHQLVTIMLVGGLEIEEHAQHLRGYQWPGDHREYHRAEINNIKGLVNLYLLRLNGAFGYRSQRDALARGYDNKTVELRNQVAQHEYELEMAEQYLWLQEAAREMAPPPAPRPGAQLRIFT